MTPRPFFTILTASLNRASTLGACLESVRTQTEPGIEQIVIDGGSTDGSLEIIKTHAAVRDLRWVSEKDTGIANALNKGLGLSRGDYIVVIHTDDSILLPQTLATVKSHILKTGCDIESYPVLKMMPDREIFYKPVKRLWWNHFKTIFPHQGCFVHRRLFERTGGFDEGLTIALDYDFFYRALKTHPSVNFHGMPVARMGGRGLSSDRALLDRRLNEEFSIHAKHETNPAWRLAQRLFKSVYFPYKMNG